MKFFRRGLELLLVSSPVVMSLDLDLTKPASIKSVASEIAFDLMSLYTGNRTGDVPGNLPSPYFWWEAGAMFGAMIDYWYYTEDTTYNDVVEQAMLHQANSPYDDYKPANQSKSLGNDDQAFWGMAAMSAAETNFQNPPKDSPQWLALAQAVFNTQAVQYEVEPHTCGGGLRWQIFTFNAGYNYKNSISNGCFFNLGSRLARYTGNATYAEWAERTYAWMEDIGLLTSSFEVYDGTDEKNNCSDFNRARWSYNVGVFLLGAANMYNYTAGMDPNGAAQAKWKARTEGLLNATDFFFSTKVPNVMEEMCEESGKCNTDQRSFKAYLSRWLAATTLVAPFTYPVIKPKLAASAAAAALQCSGGANGRICGQKWTNGAKWDGFTGVGEQMSALEIVQANLAPFVSAPVTNTTGGTSAGNPSAGTGSWLTPAPAKEITTGDRAGAGILTALVIVTILGGCTFMVM